MPALRKLLRSVPRWGLLVGLTLSVLGFVVDAVVVHARSPAAGAALATGLAAAGLGALLGLALAPIFAAMQAASGALADARFPRALKYLPVAVAALIAGERMMHGTADLAEPPRHPYASELEVLSFLGVAVLLAWLWAHGSKRPARAAALGIALGALSYDISTPRSFYRDAHDLAALITTAALLVVAYPVSKALGRASAARLWAGGGALLLSALAGVRAVEPLHPGWRAIGFESGHYAPRLARAFRLLVDLDGDGFSPIAWGGDCDDLDPARNPTRRETVPGVDANCNGVALPEHPTDADRGLAPAQGDPDLPAGAVDRVVLISIDCLRLDALRPDVMPRLSALAARGLRFGRAYSGGAQTLMSLPLMQRGSDAAPSAAERLARLGIGSTAIVGYCTLAEPTGGFGAVQIPTVGRQRWSAAEVTDRGLAALSAASSPHYLWLHYFDAHVPYPPVPADVAASALPRLPPAPPAYLVRLAFIDREIGRLLDALEVDGGLGRTAVIATADHGEAFGEHGLAYHGMTTYEPIVHVPAVLVAPGVAPGTYDGLVSHRDIAATILGAFGAVEAEREAELFGRSWLRLRAAPPPALHQFVVTRSDRAMTLYHGFAVPMAALVEGRFKLDKSFEDGQRGMYDLVADPREEHNVRPFYPEQARAMERELELYRDLDGYP